MDTSIQVLNNTIYDYFARNYGRIEAISDKNLENKYKDHTVKDLKKALSTNPDITEIKYVSHVLRDNLRNSNNTQTDTQQDQSFNHDKYFERNFWGYVKNVLASKRTVLPSFNMQDCTDHFRKTLLAIHPTKLFRIPSWIPTLFGRKARIKQRSLVITLLDLKNAFGEVHHNLIQSVLEYHHVPDHIKDIVKSLYTNFKTSVITSDFRTPFITVGRGVLQGDCLSHLLFNMCFYTFIQHIKVDKYRQFGFTLNFLNPIHWFQFADDAAVITGQESENQHLLNRFTIWCQWSNMLIRLEKCSTFGIKKLSTKSDQYLPKLFINHHHIPTIAIGESCKYLGRFFDFDMTDNMHKSELMSVVEELMSDIDKTPLHPRNKLLLYNRYVLSKLSWNLTVANLTG